MSKIKSVVAVINGQEYTLNYNSLSGKYEATVTAPATTSYHQSGHYYPVTIKATDGAGNVGIVDDKHATYGDRLKLRVKETVKPVITLENIGEGSILTNNSPSIVFTVTDTGAGVNKGTVKLKIDNKDVVLANPESVQNGFKYTYVAAGLLDGKHTITIAATDYDDNISDEFVRNFSIDTVPPTLNITAPVEGHATNNANLTVTGTTNDATSSPVTINIKVNGGDVGEVTVNENGNFAKSVTLKDGMNAIVITATDRAGKTTTVTRNVELDTTLPRFVEVTVTPNPVNCGKTYTISVSVE